MRRTERLDRRIAVPLIAVLLSSLLVSATSSATGWDNTERIEAGSFTDAGVMISQRVFPDGADAAVVVRDDRAPDALASSALAAKVGGPVLFTATDQLTPATRTELDRILDQGDTVYLAGGPQAIAPRVESALKEAGYQVTRLWGETRVETAGEIARFVGLPSGGEVLLARAFGPPAMGVEGDRTVSWVDSVSCGGYANHTTTPILLTHTEEVTPATAGYLDQLSHNRITVCGGPAAVGDAVVDDLRGRGHEVRRVWGDTRVTTAVEVAKQLFGYNTAAGRHFLLVPGYGDQFGYGLAATPLSGQLGAPILLVDRDQPTDCNDRSHAAYATLCYLATATNSAQTTNGSAAAQLTVVGNSAQVGDGVVAASAQAAGGKPGEAVIPTPGGVKAANHTTPEEGRVRVAWDAVDDARVVGYNVYYGTSSPSTKAGNANPTVPKGTHAFTVGGLQLDVNYRFAVTAVTSDGKESPKSSTVTKRTTPSSVAITSPTTEASKQVTPSAEIDVSFRYTATEGGSYQLSYRPNGASSGTPWTNFTETSTPRSVDAGTNQTKTTRVIVPGEEADFDVRVVLSVPGGTSVSDIQAKALVVKEAIDETVKLLRPADNLSVEVLPEGNLTIEFEYSSDAGGSYQLFRRSHDPTANGPWDVFEETDPPVALDPEATKTPKSLPVAAPSTEDRYDVKIEFTPQGKSPLASVASGRLYVVTPTPPEFTLPAEADVPVLTRRGNASGTIDLTFATNAGGSYQLQYRETDTSDWSDFSGQQASGFVAAGGSSGVPAKLAMPEEPLLYDLQVAFTPTADPTELTDVLEGGAAVADVRILEAPDGDPYQAQSEQPFDVDLEVTTPIEVDVVLHAAPYETDVWEPLPGGTEIVGPDGDPQPVKIEGVTAPEDAGTYDLRATLTPTTGSGSVQTVGIGKLEVQGGDASVEILAPKTGSPAQKVGGEGTFTLRFTSPVSGTYVVEHCNDEGCKDFDVSDATVDADQEKTIQLDVPAKDDTHENNTYGIVVTVTEDDTGVVHEEVELKSLRVASVEIVLPDNTGTTPPDTNGKIHVEFKTNVNGDYHLRYRKNDTTDPWTPFSEFSTSTEPVKYDQSLHTKTVTAPTAGQDAIPYDLQIELDVEDIAGGFDVSDEQIPAFTVPAEGGGGEPTQPEVVLTSPTTANPESAEPGDSFTMQFTVNTAGEYILSYRASHDPTGGWTQLAKDQAGFNPANPPTTNTVDVTAPTDPGVYDLHVQLTAAGDLTGEDEVNGLFSLVVNDAGGDTGGVQGDVVTVLRGPACVTDNWRSFDLLIRNQSGGPIEEGFVVEFTLTNQGLDTRAFKTFELKHLLPSGGEEDVRLMPEFGDTDAVPEDVNTRTGSIEGLDEIPDGGNFEVEFPGRARLFANVGVLSLSAQLKNGQEDLGQPGTWFFYASTCLAPEGSALGA